MGFECAIVGLPNVGKSTLFNALVRAQVPAENYPFCTVDPNVGLVEVPDKRLDELWKVAGPPKKVPAVLKFIDVAGLVKGASRGEGLGNQFLAKIREVDAVIHVVRCFPGEDVVHVEGLPDPVRDLEAVNRELILADLQSVERRLLKNEKMLKTGQKFYQQEKQFLDGLTEALQQEIPAVQAASPEDLRRFGLPLLTAKPALIVANISEAPAPPENELLQNLHTYAAGRGLKVLEAALKLEEELAELAEEERQEFLTAWNLEESLGEVIKAGYDLLELVTFFTTAGPEVRAWTVPRGTPAQKAAGKIHGDMEKGFVRAEVIEYERLLAAGGFSRAREKGLLRLEGRDYLIREGDVIYFRFAG